MKVKTKKTVAKRFKITASGKLKHPVGRWQHKRIKRGVAAHTRSGVERIVANKKQTKIMKQYMGKNHK